MNVIERTNLLLKLLEDQEFIMVDELAQLTGVSKATIRRDLQDLEAKNKVRRFRGGVCLNDSTVMDEKMYIHERLEENMDEKKKIAKTAASLIEDGDVIFLDSGSTAYWMIDYIEAKETRVITNSVQNAVALVAKGIPTRILGGEISLTAMNILDEDAIQKMRELNFDKAFLGASGVDQQAGYTTTGKGDCSIKMLAVKHAVKSYIMADSRKIGKRKFFTFASLDDAMCISTRSEAAEQLSSHMIFV